MHTINKSELIEAIQNIPNEAFISMTDLSSEPSDTLSVFAQGVELVWVNDDNHREYILFEEQGDHDWIEDEGKVVKDAYTGEDKIVRHLLDGTRFVLVAEIFGRHYE